MTKPDGARMKLDIWIFETSNSVTLTIAAVSLAVGGLSFLAYNHSEGYRKLFRVISVAVFLISSIHAAWTIGFLQGQLSTESADPREIVDAARKTISPFSYTLGVSFIAVYSYCLLWLPDLGLTSKHKQ
jgi:hypothetical protein